MVPSEKDGSSSSGIESGSTPLFYEVSPWTKFSLRVLGGVAALIVVITLIICLVKGSDDSMMYLVAVNMIISSITGGIIAWWYHKGTIEAKKVAFMAFVAVCITFQAIISDIYVYNKKAVTPESAMTAPTTPLPTNSSSIPTTSQ